ncbi:hypothetical protein [Actinoplanes regularis]|uniref:hypothetical protein n=1 Tax=Actinoplanes regularis TaxID=52697 RepID=UPI0025576341|nr:hypothetical protein [Actinoplanes regularis]
MLSSMYHQDWRSDGDWSAILEIFLWEGQAPPAVLALYEDSVVLGSLSRPEIEDIWTASTADNFIFGRDAGSGDEWLFSVGERCRMWLVGRGVLEPSARIAFHEIALAEDLGVQIASLMEQCDVDDRTARALAALRRCAEMLSPNLPFRLLLRVIDSMRIEISLQLYQELVLLGRRLNCGEFVVSSLEYLANSSDGLSSELEG